MANLTEFSPRKFRRKIKRDGLREATISSIELATRKTFLNEIVSWLIETGHIELVPTKSLKQNVDDIIHVTDQRVNYTGISAPFVVDCGPGYVYRESGLSTTTNQSILNEPLHPSGRGRRFVVSKIIWQLFFGKLSVFRNLLNQNARISSDHVGEIQSAAPLIPRYYDNYYHWMIETVPQIRYLHELEASTGRDISYLLHPDSPPWVMETLNHLGIPKSKVEFMSSPLYYVDELYLPSFPIQTKDDFQWIRDQLLPAVSNNNSNIEVGNNVFISRENAIERRIVNTKEIMPMLKHFGFQRYRLEDHSLEENILLFHNADIIIGAHGAGLSDLIFSNDSTVIELFGSKIKEPYKILSTTMDLNYMSFYCIPRASDLYVPPRRLQHTLSDFTGL